MFKAKHFTGQPIFNQLLSLIPRSLVSRLVREHQADRYCKRFKSYDHVVTLLYSCFHHCTSLRELSTSMMASQHRLRHLGLQHTPRRSTIADASKRRPAAFFEALYQGLYQQYYGGLPDSLKGKKLRERVFALDSTTISLFSTALQGAGSYGLNGKKKGGIKAHVLMHLKEAVPCFVWLSAARQHDASFLKQLHLPQGALVVMDKAYKDYQQFARWGREQVRFITRRNQKALYTVVVQRTFCEQQRQAGILQDAVIELGNPKTTARQPLQKARLVIFQDATTKKVYEFLTNDFHCHPLTIAELYRRRWQIELLFKSIKQNFNVQDFLGDSENAIRIQLWCTLISALLLKIIKDRYTKKRPWSMAGLAGLIRLHLTTYIDLKSFLTNPEKALLGYQPPPTHQSLLFAT